MRKLGYITIAFVTVFSGANAQETIVAHDTTNADRIKPLDKKAPNYFCKKTFDGIITEEGFKTGDFNDGELRLYEQGKLINIFTYLNKEVEGFYAAYYFPSGRIHITGSYKNSKKEGIWKEYDINGKLISTKRYHNDEQY